MKLDITKGIQKKGVDVPFELEDAWGEDHWNGDTIAYVGPVSLSGTYMLADETVLVRGEARAVLGEAHAAADEAVRVDVLRIPVVPRLHELDGDDVAPGGRKRPRHQSRHGGLSDARVDAGHEIDVLPALCSPVHTHALLLCGLR